MVDDAAELPPAAEANDAALPAEVADPLDSHDRLSVGSMNVSSGSTPPTPSKLDDDRVRCFFAALSK